MVVKEMFMVTMHYWTGRYGDMVALLGIYDSKEAAEKAIKKESVKFGLDKSQFDIDPIMINKTYHLMSKDELKTLKEEEGEDCIINYYDYSPEMYLGGYTE
jgi:hypothetical protein